MTPFQRAREAALDLRRKLFADLAHTALASQTLIAKAASESAEDFELSDVRPTDRLLGGADAALLRGFRQILIRDDVERDERAFLIAHEFGHWKLHRDDDGCYHVLKSALRPKEGETLGALKVEAYGAREQAELQANVFAREFLLPRSVARELYLSGKTASQIQRELVLPLELVRLQLVDGMLLPPVNTGERPAPELIVPTQAQTAAATSTARVSLIVAGPGTGKTTTLLMRVGHLLDGGAKPAEILLLTYSNRAARELVDRLRSLGVEDASEIWVGTFHAFGLDFLRKNHEQFGLRPQFGVADKLAQVALLEPHIYGLGLHVFDPLGDPIDWLGDVVEAIQRAKDEAADSAAFATALDRSSESTKAESRAKQDDVLKLYRCYEAQLRADPGLVDLGDLVMLPALALQRDYAKFRASVGRFKHILVDEYQDVNRASAMLVRALAAEAASLWVVGDARQAIYRFRGASMRSIIHFSDDFPEYSTFHLNENRRSFQEVVRVFEHTGRDVHPLQGVLPLEDVEPVRGESGVRPILVRCANDDIIASELVGHVHRLRVVGVNYRDQAILAGDHKTCATAADVLSRADVPVLYLGDVFQREEVKDVLCLLQLLLDRSGSGLVRAARLPGLELPAPDVESLVGWLRTTRPLPLSWLAAPINGLSTSGAQALTQWCAAFEGLTSTDSPWDVLCELLFERTQLLRPYLQGTSISDVTRRIALWQVLQFVRVPDGRHSRQTVGTFVRHLRRRLRLADDRELRMPPPEVQSLDAVAVLTIHQSKGLEFEAVHLVDVDKKQFRVSADSELIPRSLLHREASPQFSEAETEASNKLYVALSRAKKHLVLYETRSRYDADCVGAIVDAAHLLDAVEGTAVEGVGAPPNSGVTAAPGPVDQTYELAGFLTYRMCPRRYYYDFVKELTPTAGLHPAALVEGAVMRDLFVPHGSDPDAASNEVSTVLESLEGDFQDAIPHLQDYADHLLASGRAWIGAKRLAMARPFKVDCGGMIVRVSPHRTVKADRVATISFVRVTPSRSVRLKSRQATTLRWVLKHLAEAYPEYSIVGNVYILANGTTESIQPYGRLPKVFFLTPVVSALQAGNYAPRPTRWNCPKCRHFLHCPA